MSKIRTVMLFAGLLALTLVALAGCGAAPQATEESVAVVEEPTPEPTVDPKVGGTLVTTLFYEPDTLDPHKITSAASSTVQAWIDASLVTKDLENKYVPYLAESWEVSDDGLVWTFKLREDVSFHDGSPLTAQDYAWTLTRAKDGLGWVGASLISMVSAEAVDDFTLQITLDKPFAPFLDTLSNPQMGPLHQASVEAAGEAYGRQVRNGVGPYMLKEWNTGEGVLLERNPNFNWGPAFTHGGPFYIEYMDFRILPELATVIAGMETGEIDYGFFFPGLEVAGLVGSDSFQKETYLGSGAIPYIPMNLEKWPFDDLKVRQALSYGIDRENIIRTAVMGFAEPQYGILSPSTIGYFPGIMDYAYLFDAEKAEALLLEAGFERNVDGIMEKDGQPMTFTVLVSPEGLAVAQIIQQQWGAIGVQIELSQMDTAVMISQVLSGEYEMAIFGMGFQEPDLLFNMFHSSQIGGGGYNASFVRDETLDELLEASRTTMDPEGRQEVLNQIQQRINEQAYVITVMALKNFFIATQRVHDYKVSVSGAVFFNDAYLDPK